MKTIQNIISSPEGRTIEFKRDLSSIKPIMKSLVAFANTAGGILLIGKDNDGTIVGIKDIFEAEEKISNAIADSISPALMPEIEIASHEGKALLIIRVPHWRGPFYLKSQGPENGVYIRLGSTNRIAGPELIAELKRSISNTSFDQLPCPEASIHDLDPSRLEKAFSNHKIRIDTHKLESLGILVPYAGKLVCSNGGLILFGKDQLRTKLFPNTMVRCARFQGTNKVDFIDQYDSIGTIIEAMHDVPHFIRRNTRMAAKITDIRRKDIPEYSLVAIREILTNALVHADYSIQGMHTRIAIFSDRLEIENPGTLPFGFTFNELIAGVSHIRNKVIARVFRELNLMEEWGTGYKRVVDACHHEGYPTPVWEEVGTAIRVTFGPHPITQDKAAPTAQKPTRPHPRQERILQVLANNSALTAKAIHSELEQEISERTLRNELLILRDQGYIKMIGKGPNTVWKIADQFIE